MTCFSDLKNTFFQNWMQKLRIPGKGFRNGFTNELMRLFLAQTIVYLGTQRPGGQTSSPVLCLRFPLSLSQVDPNWSRLVTCGVWCHRGSFCTLTRVLSHLRSTACIIAHMGINRANGRVYSTPPSVVPIHETRLHPVSSMAGSERSRL